MKQEVSPESSAGRPSLSYCHASIIPDSPSGRVNPCQFILPHSLSSKYSWTAPNWLINPALPRPPSSPRTANTENDSCGNTTPPAQRGCWGVESDQHLEGEGGGREAGLTGNDTRDTNRNLQQIAIDCRHFSPLKFNFSSD